MTRSFRPAWPLLALFVVLAPSRADAQSESDKSTARQLGQQGQSALEAQDWKKAEDSFRRGEGLFHAPSLLLGLARAQAHQGKFVEAWENYHRIILDNASNTSVFAKALADAKAEIGSVEGRRARVTITVTGSDTPHVSVDDVPVKPEALGIERFIDPGHHVVNVSADGFKPVTTSVDVAEGKAGNVGVALEKAPVVVAAVPVAPPPSSNNQPAPASGSSLNKTLGITVLAVGGAGLVMGAVTGALAIVKHGDLSGPCSGGTCPASEQSTLSSYHTMGTLSTVGFIVGGVGVAGGVVLLLTAPKERSASSAASVSPYVGYGTVGAVGTF